MTPLSGRSLCSSAGYADCQRLVSLLRQAPEDASFIARAILEDCRADVSLHDGGRSVSAALTGLGEGPSVAFAAHLPAAADASDSASLQTAAALEIARQMAGCRKEWPGTLFILLYPKGRTRELLAENPLPETGVAGIHTLRPHPGEAGELLLCQGAVTCGETPFILRAAYREGLSKTEWEAFMQETAAGVARLSSHPQLTAEDANRMLKVPAVRERFVRAAILRTDIAPREILFFGSALVFHRGMQRLVTQRIQRLSDELGSRWKVTVTASFLPSLPPVYNDPTLCGEAGGLLRQSDGVFYRGSRSRFLPFVTDDYALLQRADGGLLFLLGAGKAYGPGEPADERCLAPGIRGVVCLLEHQLTKSTGK